MLGQEETLELIKKAQSGDESAKETLVNENSPYNFKVAQSAVYFVYCVF